MDGPAAGNTVTLDQVSVHRYWRKRSLLKLLVVAGLVLSAGLLKQVRVNCFQVSFTALRLIRKYQLEIYVYKTCNLLDTHTCGHRDLELGGRSSGDRGKLKRNSQERVLHSGQLYGTDDYLHGCRASRRKTELAKVSLHVAVFKRHNSS